VYEDEQRAQRKVENEANDLKRTAEELCTDVLGRLWRYERVLVVRVSLMHSQLASLLAVSQPSATHSCGWARVPDSALGGDGIARPTAIPRMSVGSYGNRLPFVDA
jgi:hypothetical protein